MGFDFGSTSIFSSNFTFGSRSALTILETLVHMCNGIRGRLIEGLSWRVGCGATSTKSHFAYAHNKRALHALVHNTDTRVRPKRQPRRAGGMRASERQWCCICVQQQCEWRARLAWARRRAEG